MSDRERWIVYPLLFLALGAALRDKVTHTVETGVVDADLIRCKAIMVGETVTRTPIPRLPGGTIATYSAQGRPQVIIGSETTLSGSKGELASGEITVHGFDGKPIIAMRGKHGWYGKRAPQVEDDSDEKPKQLPIEVKGLLNYGGQIQVWDGAMKHALELEHLPGQLGLYVSMPENRLVPLSRGVHVRRRRPVNPPGKADPGATATPPSAPEPREN